MTLADAVTYLPWVISGASALAALIPPTAVNANPTLKALTAFIDFMALNFGQAKKGPTPVAVMSELVTGNPSPQRTEVGKL